MDGARLMNAVVASGVPAAEFTRGFDTAWLDFTKGLGAPLGACLAGSAELIEEAWRYKQMLGGALRQAGIVAAGALYALDHHVDRLADDHENARTLANGLAALPGVTLDPDEVETNIVIFEVDDPEGLCSALQRDGVLMGPVGPRAVRAVTHLDVDADGVQRALEAVRKGDCDEARRHPPHHGDHRRCAAQRRLLRAGARAADGEEVGQPGRPDRLPPLLRRREGLRGLGPDVLRVSERARRAAPAPGWSTAIVHRVGSADTLDFWADRLGDEGVATSRVDGGLRFADPEGLEHEFRVVDVPDTPLTARSTEVPDEHALQGFHAVHASVADPRKTEKLLADVLNFESRGEHEWEARGEARGGSIVFEPASGRGFGGAGTIHHIAWATLYDEHDAWRAARWSTAASSRRR